MGLPQSFTVVADGGHSSAIAGSATTVLSWVVRECYTQGSSSCLHMVSNKSSLEYQVAAYLTEDWPNCEYYKSYWMHQRGPANALYVYTTGEQIKYKCRLKMWECEKDIQVMRTPKTLETPWYSNGDMTEESHAWFAFRISRSICQLLQQTTELNKKYLLEKDVTKYKTCLLSLPKN